MKRINGIREEEETKRARGDRELRLLGHHIPKSYRSWMVKERDLEALEGDGMH